MLTTFGNPQSTELEFQDPNNYEQRLQKGLKWTNHAAVIVLPSKRNNPNLLLMLTMVLNATFDDV